MASCMEIGMVGGCDFHGSNCRRRHHEREPGWRRSEELCAVRFFIPRGGESYSLAYRTVHWRKLKPANHELSLAAPLRALCVLLQMRLFVSFDDMIG